MKNILTLLFLVPSIAFAGDISSKWSIGLAAENMAGNHGLSLRAATPFFINGGSIELSGGHFAHPTAVSGRFEYSGIQSYMASYSYAFLNTQQVRSYAKFGFGALIPSKKISDNIAFNGRLSMGVEFFPSPESRFSPFMEIGHNHAVNERAEKETDQPFYANGLYASIGVKLNL